MAAEYDLPNRDRPDSQGLCFLGKVKFDDFLGSYLGEDPGDILDVSSPSSGGDNDEGDGDEGGGEDAFGGKGRGTSSRAMVSYRRAEEGIGTVPEPQGVLEGTVVRRGQGSVPQRRARIEPL